MDYVSEIKAELEKAENSRARGNEGQARVCARRAAGIAARGYLTRKGIHTPSPSAMDLLALIQNEPRLSPSLKLIANHLTQRVDEKFKLPANVDLIAEARLFCEVLLETN